MKMIVHRRKVLAWMPEQADPLLDKLHARRHRYWNEGLYDLAAKLSCYIAKITPRLPLPPPNIRHS